MIVPVTTLSLFFLAIGKDSPLIIDSSTKLSPESIVPSTGIASPGRTISVSPAITASMGTSREAPCSTIVAVFGRRSRSARIALEVWRRARISRYLPNVRNAARSTAVSKNMNWGERKRPNVAMTLATYAVPIPKAYMTSMVRLRLRRLEKAALKMGALIYKNTGVEMINCAIIRACIPSPLFIMPMAISAKPAINPMENLRTCARNRCSLISSSVARSTCPSTPRNRKPWSSIAFCRAFTSVTAGSKTATAFSFAKATRADRTPLTFKSAVSMVFAQLTQCMPATLMVMVCSMQARRIS